MSYQVLARKWRPANFDQVVGQSHVLHALTNALSQQRLHHAYLFTGTRGVGKTSLARLFAKGLNCETGVTANPCGKCASCVEIAEGRFVDLIEVDAASRTKVDDTRELLDNVQYRPSRGRFKVYLIDEVHMLSRSSFNALLKTLEEPPEHVKFLLATTDPQKLPVTVLSRCLQFNLKSLTQDDIAGQLDHVLTQEQLPFEPQALTLLAKSANGSMRDALSLTDQAIAFGAGQVMLQQVQTMLGTIDEQQVIALLDALLKGDIANLMHLTAQILSYGAEADEVLRSLLELLHQITLTQFAPAASQMSLYSEQIKGFAGSLKPEQIQLYYQILLTGRKDLPHAPDPKSGLEMALLRAVAFLPESVAGHWTPAREGEGTPGKGKPAGGATGTELASAASTASPTTAAQTSAKTAAAAEAKPQSVALPAADNDANLNLTTDAKADANADSDIEPDAAAIGDDDTAMLAEQALLLSQAESMGYGEPSQPEDSGKTLKEEDKASTPAAESDKLQTGSTQPEPLPKQTSADTSLSRQTAHQTALQGADLQASAEVNDAAEALTMTADSESAFTDDADSHDNSYPASGEDDLSSYEQYFTGVDDFLPVDDSIPAEDALLAEGAYSQADGSYSRADGSYTPDAGMAGNAVTDMSSLSFEHTERSGIQPAPVVSTQVNSVAPALDDDFLDSVLAARDSLLAGLKLDDEPEDGAAQVKTVVKTPVKTPGKSQIPAKPEASKSAEPELSDAEPASRPNDLNDHSESLSSAAPVQHTENQNLSTEQEQSQYRVHNSAADTQDRPPWEEPAEQPVAVMPDKQDTFSAEFSAHDEMSDVEEAPTDEIFDNLTPEQEAQSPSLQESPQAEGSAQQAATAEVQSHPLPALASDVTGHELDLHWYKQMSALKIGGRVRQLAVNSVCYAWGEQIELLLKPDQKHLAAAVAIEQLRAALVEVAGFELTVNIQIGSDEQRETPREVRSRFHSELLAQARSALHQDDNIRWLMSFMGAQLDDDSVVYPPELLSLKGRSIPELGSQ